MKLKLILWIAGVLIAGVLTVKVAALLVPANFDPWAIRHDLHLGFSPCRVARLASSSQSVRVAIAALSDAGKRDLKARYPWHQVTSDAWDDKIPWFSDLSASTEFDPVLRHARGAGRGGKEGKLVAHYNTPKREYYLVLDDDRNILWIVRHYRAENPRVTIR